MKLAITHRTRRLGQHKLIDVYALQLIVRESLLTRDDTVFEIGTGDGRLTGLLCEKAGKVVSCEIDSDLYAEARRNLSENPNLELLSVDAFRVERPFDVLVSNLPYSRSADFLYWLATKKFKRAVVTVQREFAEKMTAYPSTEGYGAVSVIAQSSFEIQRVAEISRSSFKPSPKVGSTVLRLSPILPNPISEGCIGMVKLMFSYRRKKVGTAVRYLVPEARRRLEILDNLGKTCVESRVDQLPPKSMLNIASLACKKLDE